MNNMPSALWRTEAPWRADHSVCAEPPRCRRIQPGSQLWLGSSVVPGVLGSLPAGAPRGALRWPHTLSAWSSFCQGQLWARGLLDSPPPSVSQSGPPVPGLSPCQPPRAHPKGPARPPALCLRPPPCFLQLQLPQTPLKKLLLPASSPPPNPRCPCVTEALSPKSRYRHGSLPFM